MNISAKSILLWAVVVFVLILLWNFYGKFKDTNVMEIDFTEFYKAVKEKPSKIRSVRLSTNEAEGEFTDARKFRTTIPAEARWDLIKELYEAGVRVAIIKPEQSSSVYSFFTSWLPFLLITGFWIYLMRRMRPKK